MEWNRLGGSAAETACNDEARQLDGQSPERQVWDEPGAFIGELPIRKAARAGDFEYVLTHSMQYENLSIVTAEIKYLKETAEPLQIVAPLILAILGGTEYEVFIHGGRGGDAQLQLHFMVSPPLPEQPGELEFSLIPAFEGFPHLHPAGVILDKQIKFP